MDECFFCNPDKSRMLFESERFYAILGLGPIVEGYVLLCAKQHIRSMLDLPLALREEYQREKARLREVMGAAYAPPIMTEHGRVQACFAEDVDGHERHCFHAHQHFFPTDADVSPLVEGGPIVEAYCGTSLFDMNSHVASDVEYLLFEDVFGVTHGYTVDGKCPRQLMRYLVATSLGMPDLTDWRRHPYHERISSALRVYRRLLAPY